MPIILSIDVAKILKRAEAANLFEDYQLLFVVDLYRADHFFGQFCGLRPHDALVYAPNDVDFFLQ